MEDFGISVLIWSLYAGKLIPFPRNRLVLDRICTRSNHYQLQKTPTDNFGFIDIMVEGKNTYEIE
jgi:hypothetical protein